MMLAYDTSHSVQDASGRRYPVVDGIPFLRAGRKALADEALMLLEAGHQDEALVALLADYDDWWRGPVAEPEALRELVRMRNDLTLRDAMGLLAWGPVLDYFAHRWTDPTYLGGLALVEAHCTAPRRAFELACGIGHHLRALTRTGASLTGVDVVFAKLWIARHWVVPQARLLCLDAAQDWPLAEHFDLVACHDAFYFLEPKSEILARLRSLLDPANGLLAISHVHNKEWDNFSAGAALSARQFADLLPDAVFYDDNELTHALVEARAPRPTQPEALRQAEAFAAVAGPALQSARAVTDWLAMPKAGAKLSRNPLYDRSGHLTWPSDRYGREYGPRATYPLQTAMPERVELNSATAGAARRRELVELPERW